MLGDFFLDVWEFIVAVLVQWASLLTGGIVVGAVVIYERFRKPLPRAVAIAAITLALFVAVFLPWREKHRALVVAAGSIADLEAHTTQLKAQLEHKCPPQGVVAYSHDWHNITRYGLGDYGPSLPKKQTQPEHAKRPVAVRISVDGGSIRYLDTGDKPTRTRGHRVPAGEQVWICGRSIAEAKFVAVDEPGEEARIQVTYYRGPE